MSDDYGKIIQSNQLIFRKPLLFYLKTNATPRVSLKLMQISRFFCYREFPYMVVKDLSYHLSEWTYFQLGKRFIQKLDLNNLSKPFWITDKLCLLDAYDENLLSHLLSKTPVCDIKDLVIDYQHIKMDDFKFLISSKIVEGLGFQESQVFYDDGSVVPLEEIVKLLPNLKEFNWTSNNPAFEITPATTQKLIEYLNPSFLTEFYLEEIPETFNFKLFTEFMDQNHSITYILRFNDHLSDEYAKILQTFVDKLIETGEYKNRRILIKFQQQNEEFDDILFEQFCDSE